MELLVILSMSAAIASAIAALLSAYSSRTSSRSSCVSAKLGMMEHLKGVEKIIEADLAAIKSSNAPDADKVKEIEGSLRKTRKMLNNIHEQLESEFMPKEK